MKKFIIYLSATVVFGAAIAFGLYKYIESTLPKLITLEDYQPLLVSQVYDRNQKKIGEFFRERRVLVPYKQIPKDLVNAILAAEDDSFFQHSGINYLAIMRAAIANLKAGRTVQGASTITQQVAKTLMLTSEKTFIRKFKEALLSQQMEENLSKEDILYLYLNQIYFGQGAYGISLAAETYFRKPVAKLSLAEMAILAGLPKAPSAYSPIHNPKRAKERQIYVLNRMAEVGFIDKKTADAAALEPIKVYTREKFEEVAPFYLENLRQLLFAELGEDTVLEKGLKIYTGLDSTKQIAAQNAMIEGLKSVDKRQGFRGSVKNITDPKEVGEFLTKTRNKMILEVQPERIIQPDGSFVDYGPLNIQYDLKKNGLPYYMRPGTRAEAIVSKVDDEKLLVFIRMGEVEGVIDFETMKWARKPNPDKRFDLDQIKKPSEALKMGDVILAQVMAEKFYPPKHLQPKTKDKNANATDWGKYFAAELDQEPIVQGALLSIDQNTQEVIAHVGGYNFEKKKFDMALQAKRQTGSSFKSIVYASALDKGYTPATPIMDAPIVFDESKEDEEGQGDEKTWKPANHSKSFGGDIIFRNALVKSLNIPSVKIIEDIKVDWAIDYSQRLGIFSPLNPDFTLVLGSSSVTLYEMTKVFSEFGRLGKKTKPLLVRRIEDSKGKKIYDTLSLDKRYQKEIETIETLFEERRTSYLESKKNPQAESSAEEQKNVKNQKADENFFFDNPDQLIKPTTSYLITSLLKAVVEDKQGTGGRARALGREVAGKTGSSNGYYDAWFIGYTPQIATGVWVGFEQEKTLGKGEVGGRAALPAWVDYMKAAHEDLPQVTFPVPDGIVFANIDSETGEVASATSKNIVRQAFLEGTEPTGTRNKKEEDTDFYKQDLSE